MKHYLYECTDPDSECEGEEFLVGANDREEARQIAIDNFKCARFICEMTDYEAEQADSMSIEEPHMTIYEKIKTLSLEDMAEFLTEYSFGCDMCEEDERLSDCLPTKDEHCDEQCKKHCIVWLNKTARYIEDK